MRKVLYIWDFVQNNKENTITINILPQYILRHFQYSPYKHLFPKRLCLL